MRILALALFARILCAQQPAGVIEGSLRDAISRAPLADAHISLRGPSSGSLTTGAGGEFHFDQLLPGEYELSIRKSGYLDSNAAAPIRNSVRLKPGAVTETVVIDLTPLGALEGAVLDEAGKPLQGVSVMVAGVSHITDATGRFAFEDVVPGSYQVAVNVPHDVRSRNLVREPSTGDYYGYAAAQYYPGADDPRLAIPVVIPAGARLRNIDLRLRRTLLVEFSGRLIEMSGREPIVGAGVRLTAASGMSDPLWRKETAAPDGSFRFSLVQPGAYTLAVTRTERSPLPYLIPIEIGKTGIDDMPVSIPPYANLPVTVKLPDPQQKFFGTVSVRLQHRSGPTASLEVRPGSTLEFENVPPGEYTVAVQAGNLRLRPDAARPEPARRLSLSAVHLGSQDGFRKPVTIVENGNPPLEVQLSDEPAGIAGKVITDGAPESSASIVVIVTALAQPRRMLAGVSATSEFQFPDLAPGDYEVTAARGRISGGFEVKTCDETARVTVRDGAVSYLTLRPCR